MMKEIEDDTNKWKDIYHAHGLEKLSCYVYPGQYTDSVHSVKILMTFPMEL